MFNIKCMRANRQTLKKFISEPAMNRSMKKNTSSFEKDGKNYVTCLLL